MMTEDYFPAMQSQQGREKTHCWEYVKAPEMPVGKHGGGSVILWACISSKLANC